MELDRSFYMTYYKAKAPSITAPATSEKSIVGENNALRTACDLAAAARLAGENDGVPVTPCVASLFRICSSRPGMGVIMVCFWMFVVKVVYIDVPCVVS